MRLHESCWLLNFVEQCNSKSASSYFKPAHVAGSPLYSLSKHARSKNNLGEYATPALWIFLGQLWRNEDKANLSHEFWLISEARERLCRLCDLVCCSWFSGQWEQAPICRLHAIAISPRPDPVMHNALKGTLLRKSPPWNSIIEESQRIQFPVSNSRSSCFHHILQIINQPRRTRQEISSNRRIFYQENLNIHMRSTLLTINAFRTDLEKNSKQNYKSLIYRKGYGIERRQPLAQRSGYAAVNDRDQDWSDRPKVQSCR